MWRGSLLVLGAVAIGLVGWSGDARMLPVAMGFPLLWSRSPSRLVAGLVSTGYFLAASRGLPQGVSNYYDTVAWHGVLLWVAASIAFIVVHVVLWTEHSTWGQANPVIAAGVLFPGTGWWGLGATLLACCDDSQALAACYPDAGWPLDLVRGWLEDTSGTRWLDRIGP
jgi:hypothetical protein